jgi:GST-like protein
MWQMGSAPFIGGGFGHFYFYAPEKIEYAINRYAMETKRLLDVADRRLSESRFLAGDDYTIADMATFGWFRG